MGGISSMFWIIKFNNSNNSHNKGRIDYFYYDHVSSYNNATASTTSDSSTSSSPSSSSTTTTTGTSSTIAITSTQPSQPQEQVQQQQSKGKSNRRRIIYRYDDAGFHNDNSNIYLSKIHYLPNAIPISRTVPIDMVENRKYHLQQRKNTTTTIAGGGGAHNYSTDYRTLYLMNPSIVKIKRASNGPIIDNNNNGTTATTTAPSTATCDDDATTTAIIDVHDGLYYDDWYNLTQGGNPNITYVAIYRVFTGCNCFGVDDPKRELMKKDITAKAEQLSYLAIVLLDTNLDIIPNTDILIDMNNNAVHNGGGLPPQPPGSHMFGDGGRQPIEDCRIYLLKHSFYLLCNNQFHRIQIQTTLINSTTTTSNSVTAGTFTASTTNGGSNDNKGRSKQINRKVFVGGGSRKKGGSTLSTKANGDVQLPYVYENVYGTGLQVTNLGYISKLNSNGGKNFNIFKIPTKGSSSSTSTTKSGYYEYYVQITPVPHTYKRLILPDPKVTPVGLQYYSFPIQKAITSSIDDVDNTTTTSIVHPSFDTIDALHPIELCEEEQVPLTTTPSSMSSSTTTYEGKKDRRRRSSSSTTKNRNEIKTKKQKMKNCTNYVERPFFGDPFLNDKHYDHGSACCIKLDLNGNNNNNNLVLVGITHTKLSTTKPRWLLDRHQRYNYIKKNRYVSRFVAYNMTPPFHVVAVSGWFCLGFGRNSDNDNKNNNNINNNNINRRNHHIQQNTLGGKNVQYKLDLFNVTYDCPVIHFVSGIEEYYENDENDHSEGPSSKVAPHGSSKNPNGNNDCNYIGKVIITYGVNDCYPRMIVVTKQDIRNRLLGNLGTNN